MRSTSFSGARSWKAALNWSMTVAVSIMTALSAGTGLTAMPGRAWRRGPEWASIIADVSMPERAAALAHRPPVEPAGTGDAGGDDAAAPELHRTGPLPTRPQRGRAAGGVAGAHAARAQRAAPRRRFRPGVSGVTARGRGAPPGPPGDRHDPRRPPPVPGDGRTTTRDPRDRQPGVRTFPRRRRPRVSGAAGQHVPPRPPPQWSRTPSAQPARVGQAHHSKPAG